MLLFLRLIKSLLFSILFLGPNIFKPQSVLAASQTADSGYFAITAGSTAGMSFDVFSQNPKVTTYDINLGVGHTFSLLLPLEGFVLFDYLAAKQSGSSASYAMEIDGQLNYLIFGESSDALYGGFRYGKSANNDGSTKITSSNMGFIVGKRFSFSGPVSFDPNVGLNIITYGNNLGKKANFKIVPLQFTMFL